MPEKAVDASAWLSIMNYFLTLQSSIRVEDMLKKPLAGSADVGETLKALGEAFDSERFKTLGLNSESKKIPDATKSQKNLIMVIGAQLFLTHGTNNDYWRTGVSLIDRAVRMGWAKANSARTIRRWSIMKAAVNTDCPGIVRSCAHILGEDLHPYFQQACNTGSTKVFEYLAPRQAKRYDSLSLQRAIVSYNVDLVERLIPFSVPRKSDSLCLRKAAESITELEGLGIFGYQTSKMKNMTEELRAKHLEDAKSILCTIAQHCDAADALRLDKGNKEGKKNEERDRIRELVLLHAPASQWKRVAKRKVMRDAIPAVKAWHVKHQLDHEANRGKESGELPPRKPRAI